MTSRWSCAEPSAASDHVTRACLDLGSEAVSAAACSFLPSSDALSATPNSTLLSLSFMAFSFAILADATMADHWLPRSTTVAQSSPGLVEDDPLNTHKVTVSATAIDAPATISSLALLQRFNSLSIMVPESEVEETPVAFEVCRARWRVRAY